MAIEINEYLQYEILLRMRAEELFRLKTVSTFWYRTIICSPEFARLHLSNSCDSSILLKRDDHHGNILLTLLYPNLCVPPLDIKFPDVEYDIPFEFDIHGHSHGIICFNANEDLFVWNPITAELRKLPPPTIRGWIIMAIGFGYDNVSKGLKVVRVMFNLKFSYKAHIFYLSKNEWKEISSSGFEHVWWNPSMEMHFKGIYYWCAIEFDVVGKLMFLLSFNFTQEVFERIMLPESFRGEHGTQAGLSIGVLNGSIILLHYPTTSQCGFKVWKLENGGVWTKVLTMDRDHINSDIQKPLLFLNSNQILMESNNEKNVVLYQLNTKHKKILLKGNPLVSSEITAIPFQPSLFSTMGNAKF